MVVNVHIIGSPDLFCTHLKQAVESLPGTKVVSYTCDVDDIVSLVAMGSPHVVILDLDFDMKGGFVREIFYTIHYLSRKAIVVVLSDSSDSIFRQRATDWGADYFFDKSIEYGVALETIGEVITELERSK
jgi:two-component system, NarL family, response regulator DevR